ncbi:MAG TPA: Wzt carbohydrate-binding domain-containing protein, partial [Bacteroidia bacterium]|nr:Wzt carbohydrate-binding domain-containing protein [Bacteroidia bacterium]
VLFVSHNMASIRMLCSKCMFLEKGQLKSIGDTDTIIGTYLSSNETLQSNEKDEIPLDLSLYNTGEAKFKKAFVLNSEFNKSDVLDFLEPFSVQFEIEVFKPIVDGLLSLFIVNQYGERILMAAENEKYKPQNFEKGYYSVSLEFEENLMPGNYSLGLSLAYFHTGSNIDFIESFYSFTVSKESKAKNMEYPWATIHGYIRPKTNWKINKL